MAFSIEIRDAVDVYARGDLAGGLDAHVAHFSFLGDDPDLQRRVGEEFYSARYLYKLFEGLRIEYKWGRRAQIQLQVQQYASIYEACIHHVLFTQARDTDEVKSLMSHPTLKRVDVAPHLQERLDAAPLVNEQSVVAAIKGEIKLQETKVRFDSKIRAAVDLGVISQVLGDELNEFYRARNMIHIHAELKKGATWEWEIDFSRRAYRRLQPLRQEIIAWQGRTGIVAATAPGTGR